VREPKRLLETPAVVVDASDPLPAERRVASTEWAGTGLRRGVTTAERYTYGVTGDFDRGRADAADRMIRGEPEAAPATDSTAVVDTTLAHYIRMAYHEPLADSSTFLRLPYKAKFTRDYIAGAALFASNVGFAGSSAISFSDVLGNHNLLAVLNLYGDLRESDIFLAYTNLKKRTNWGGALFQYRTGRLLLSTSDTDDVEDQIYRGGTVFFSRPFSRFRRFEFGTEAAVIDERVLQYN
jgi:hypothetical protein